MKAVLATGNGISGYTLLKIFEKIKTVRLIKQYIRVDFSFPNHIPHPLDFKTPKDLQKRARKEKADFGIAIEGDRDRCIFIDETGQIISPDLIIALIAQHLLQEHPRAKIIYDVRCSKVVKETIEEQGGKAAMSRVGHSFIKKDERKKLSLLESFPVISTIKKITRWKVLLSLLFSS